MRYFQERQKLKENLTLQWEKKKKSSHVISWKNIYIHIIIYMKEI